MAIDLPGSAGRYLRAAVAALCMGSVAPTAGPATLGVPPVAAPEPGKDSASDPLRHARLSIRVYNDRDGLPQNSIETVGFDKQGYLWIGTQDGAVRYDG